MDNSEILGYDCDGRALRAGDPVRFVETPEMLRDACQYSWFVSSDPVLSPYPQYVAVRTNDIDMPPDGCRAPGFKLSKIDDDHQPADADFTEWVRDLGRPSEKRIEAGMPWSEPE